MTHTHTIISIKPFRPGNLDDSNDNRPELFHDPLKRLRQYARHEPEYVTSFLCRARRRIHISPTRTNVLMVCRSRLFAPEVAQGSLQRSLQRAPRSHERSPEQGIAGEVQCTLEQHPSEKDTSRSRRRSRKGFGMKFCSSQGKWARPPSELEYTLHQVNDAGFDDWRKWGGKKSHADLTSVTGPLHPSPQER